MILLRYLKYYLLNEMHPSPLLFFTVFILKDLLTDLAHYYLIFYFLALFLALYKQFNMLYMLPVFLYTQNNYLSGLFFLISALSCTKRWKVYLFIYALAQTYLTFGNQSARFTWVLSAAMCFVIYKNLIFQTSGEDVKYFIGFFITCILNLCFALASYIQIELNIFSLLLVLWLSGLLSHSIINKRLKQIRSMKIQDIKHPAIMIRYIDLQLEDLQEKTIELAKLKLHFDECRLVKCSCKINKYSKDFYVRQMFQHFMKSLGSLGDERLWQYYIDFYLSKDQFVIPYYNLLKWRPRSYISLINKLKTEAKIAKLLQKANQKITYDKQYIYGLQYDKKCQKLSSQIYQILKLKIDFWKEVARQSLSLKKLQNLGLKIIDRMQKLNQFYTHTIKQYEKYLYCFDFTILYAIYLIFSTNFKDYADSLVKNIAKILQKGSMKENNTSQTFVIKAVVQNSKISLTKRYTRSFQNQKEISTLLKLQEMYQNEFKLIIDAVSNGFCKIVNIPKKQIIGSQLNSLIPNCYKEIHNVRLTQILDFNSDVIKDLLPSQVLHSNLVLLFKGAKDQLFAGLICIKYNMDINAGLSFLSVIKKPTQNRCIALTNLSGVLMQKQKGFPCEIIKHQEVRRYLAKLKKIWVANRTIQEQKFNLSINRISYEFTIDSPYAHLLSDKACLSNNQPPIHIQLLDEQSVKNRFINQIHGRNHFRDQVTKIQKMIKEQKQTSIASSVKTTNSNRAGAAVTIIYNFWQNNSIPVYKYITLAFTIFVICSTILNLIMNIKYILQWDNASTVQNPIVDTTNLYNIQILLTKGAMNFQDMIYYQKYLNILNTSRISSYYSGKAFPQWNAYVLQDIAYELESSMADIWVNYSTILWPQIQKRFNQNIVVNSFMKAQSYYKQSTQTWAYGQLLFNFAVDNMLISQPNKYSGLLFPHLLAQVRNQTSSLLELSDIVYNSFSSSLAMQLVMGLIFSTLIIIFTIPMCLVLRMRARTHERVFDLLSSIDCQSIKKEIQSLLYISNILNNYKEYKYKFNHYLITQQSSFFINRDSKQFDNSSSSVFKNIIKGREEQRSQTSINIPLKNGKKLETENILFDNLKYNGWQKDQTYELFRSIKSEIFEQMSKSANLKCRKRSGELDLTGSEHDPKKYFTFKHCAIYLLLLSFIPFVLISMFISRRYIQHSQITGQQIYSSYMQTHQFNTKISEIKTYLWEGKDALKSTYNMTDQLNILQDMLVNGPNYTTFSSHLQDDFSASDNDDVASFAQSINTLKLTQSEILTIVNILVQLRYNLQYNNNRTTTQSDFQILYEQIFQLQFLINIRQDINQKIADYIQEDMFNLCIESRRQKRIMLILLLIWSLTSYGLGMMLIHGMKHQYFEEVCILSFLNNEMLSKNKRVQSYLDNLSKNTNY